MPLHERLIKALTSDDETNNLAKIVTKLAGLPGLPDHTRAAYNVDKMSMVRNLHPSAFTPLRAMQTPPHQMVPRIKLTTSRRETSWINEEDELETYNPYPRSQMSKEKYLKAKHNLLENISTINNIQKWVEQLNIAARTSITSEDFNTMSAERMKPVDKINFINTWNIWLMKDLHQLVMQQLNSSKADESTADPLHMEHQEIETLLNHQDILYEERKTDRIWLKELKKQADAFRRTKSFVPTLYESQHHLYQIQAQLDLDKKIQKMSHLINYAVKICEQKSDEMDEKSKTKLDKSKKQEVRFIKQEKAASLSSSPTLSTWQEKHVSWTSSKGSNLLHLLTNCKHYSGHPNAARWMSPPKPPPHNATSRGAKKLSCSKSKASSNDKTMQPDTGWQNTSTRGKH
jgi:hypothetical protein